MLITHPNADQMPGLNREGTRKEWGLWAVRVLVFIGTESGLCCVGGCGLEQLSDG